MAVEPRLGKCVAVGPTDPECLDEGKQAKSVYGPETIRPPTLWAPGVANEKVVMEMRDGSDVPGVTGQGACEKTVYVVVKIGDDLFDNLQGEFGGRGRACHRSLRRSIPVIHLVDSCFSSIPKSLGKQLTRCSGGL